MMNSTFEKTRYFTTVALVLSAVFIFLCPSCDKPLPTPDQAQANLKITPRGSVAAGSPITWTVAWKVTTGGVKPGGSLAVVFPHPYYNNRPANMLPQIDDPQGPGYAAATRNGEPVSLAYKNVPLKPHALELVAGGEGWKAGDRIEIRIGTGTGGEATMAAPYFAAEKFSPIVLLDADGKGLFERLDAGSEDFINVVGSKAVSAQVVAPSVVSKGEAFDVTVRFFDMYRNPAAPPEAVEVVFNAVALDREDKASYGAPPAPLINWQWAKVRGGVFGEAGYFQLQADFGKEFSPALSNPIRVTESQSPKKIYFGDIHGHTWISDGLNSPESYYDVAAGPAALDFAAVTDHEWQIDFEEWAGLIKLCVERNKPGDFVALLAWEFSFGGHGIVYYDRCDAMPEMPPDGPRQLWQVLFNNAQPYTWVKNGDAYMRGWGDKTLLTPPEDATFIPHTSGTMDMGNDWDSFDPAATGAVEIYSSHGCNESADHPRRVEPFAESGSVMTALKRGFRTGFVAASDGHDSRPGLSTWGRFPGGLTAIEAGALTHRTVFDAIRGGRTYATSGARIILNVTLNGLRPGRMFVPAEDPFVEWEAAGDADIQSVEIIKNGETVYEQLIAGRSPRFPKFTKGRWTDAKFDGPAWYYLRLTQVDGQQAWSSPFEAHHPSWADIKDFRAENAGMGVEISWEAESGLGSISFGILKRLGDSGGGDPSLYTAVGPGEIPAGKFMYRDVEPLETGVTAYYILEERNDFGVRHIGPVAARSTFFALPLDDGQWKLGYYANARGQARIIVRDIDGQVVRVLVEGEKGPGYHARIWDGKNDRGETVDKLCFYQAEAAGILSPQKPILNNAPVSESSDE